jgi:hypothetical protein
MRNTLVWPLVFSLSGCVTMQFGSCYDTPRRDNLDPNRTTAREGIGASIAQITS